MIRLSILAIMLLGSTSLWANEPLRPRVETNLRAGDARSIFMTEFWIPFHEGANGESVLYGDFRLMGDNDENREGNLGVGYREIIQLSHLGRGVAGASAWIDRRKTRRDSIFYQAVLGGEWLTETLDVRMNGYVPLSNSREFSSSANTASLIGTGIFVNTGGLSVEEPQYGADVEVGYELGALLPQFRAYTDAFRVYGGGYFFDGDQTDETAGYHMRLAIDMSQNIQLGARFQNDSNRGSQGFLEATFRFPFGQKRSFRKEGLRARLDESPERDIDIVTGEIEISSGQQEQALNIATGVAQEVLFVDNTAAGGGDGSIENPFNTLADAQAASSAHSIIYVAEGDGTSANQNAGITLNQQGQQLIGSGSDFIFDSSKLSLASGAVVGNVLIREASTAPVISNAAGDGITITADDVLVSGITVDNASLDGIDALNADNLTIRNVTLSHSGNRGLLYRVTDNVDGYNLDVSSLEVNDSGSDAVQMRSNGDATISFTDITSRDNAGNALEFISESDAVVNMTTQRFSSTNDQVISALLVARDTSQFNVDIDAITITDNTTGTGRGLQIQAQNNSTIDVEVQNSRFENNLSGILVFGSNDGTANLAVTNSIMASNAQNGMQHNISGNANITSSVASSQIINNGDNGVRYFDNSTGAITADLGGGALGSAGQNQIFNNASFDLRVDLDGGTVAAENNWWGTAAGLQVGDRDLADGNVDATPFLTSAP